MILSQCLRRLLKSSAPLIALRVTSLAFSRRASQPRVALDARLRRAHEALSGAPSFPEITAVAALLGFRLLLKQHRSVFVSVFLPRLPFEWIALDLWSKTTDEYLTLALFSSWFFLRTHLTSNTTMRRTLVIWRDETRRGRASPSDVFPIARSLFGNFVEATKYHLRSVCETETMLSLAFSRHSPTFQPLVHYRLDFSLARQSLHEFLAFWSIRELRSGIAFMHSPERRGRSFANIKNAAEFPQFHRPVCTVRRVLKLILRAEHNENRDRLRIRVQLVFRLRLDAIAGRRRCCCCLNALSNEQCPNVKLDPAPSVRTALISISKLREDYSLISALR